MITFFINLVFYLGYRSMEKPSWKEGLKTNYHPCPGLPSREYLDASFGKVCGPDVNVSDVVTELKRRGVTSLPNPPKEAGSEWHVEPQRPVDFASTTAAGTSVNAGGLKVGLSSWGLPMVGTTAAGTSAPSVTKSGVAGTSSSSSGGGGMTGFTSGASRGDAAKKLADRVGASKTSVKNKYTEKKKADEFKLSGGLV